SSTSSMRRARRDPSEDLLLGHEGAFAGLHDDVVAGGVLVREPHVLHAPLKLREHLVALSPRRSLSNDVMPDEALSERTRGRDPPLACVAKLLQLVAEALLSGVTSAGLDDRSRLLSLLHAASCEPNSRQGV